MFLYKLIYINMVLFENMFSCKYHLIFNFLYLSLKGFLLVPHASCRGQCFLTLRALFTLFPTAAGVIKQRSVADSDSRTQQSGAQEPAEGRVVLLDGAESSCRLI